MKNNTRYKHRRSIYGVDATFIHNDGCLRRITNNPNDIPLNFKSITTIVEEDWIEDTLDLKTPFSYDLIVTIHNHEKLKGMVEVESEEYGFRYCSPWESHHGIQTNFLDESMNKKLMELCDTITKAAKEIEKLYKENGK